MALGKNKKMAIKISDTAINILIGNKNRIYETHNIALENGVCKDGTVRDTDNIIELLNEYLDVNARDVKDVSFVLRGSDIITRYIEVPILKEDALREAVNYEFRQFIPEIDDYYTNYEIIEKINTQEKKAYKILLVAVTRKKIDPIVEISEGINKELDVIDVLSNTIARVLRSSDQIIREESTGVFYFGSDSSTLTIIEDNILKFERNLPFGVKNIFNQAYLEMSASTLDIKEIEDVFDRNPNLTNSFQNLLSSVNNTIRYYNSDKKNKPVTNFIIICADIAINNMEKYLEKYFELPCLLIKDPIDLGLKIKFDENFSQYIASYGLFLRNNKKLLNLNPKAIYNVKDKEKLDKLLVALTLTVLLLMASISVPFIIINKIMAKDIASIEAEIVKYEEIVEKNTQLKAENSQIEYFINRVKNIENSTTKTSEILAKVNTYVPKEITFMSLSFSNSGSINISGESDTYSAIPGKGIQPIVNDLRGYYKTKRVDGKKKSVWVPSILLSDEENTRYCYKIDLHHYYQSINHEVLKQKFRKVFKDSELLWLLDEIADSINTATEEDLIELSLSGEIEVDPNTGIPIGNYMSQYSGNFYLSSFDHWVKEELHVKHYYRYMDDVVIFASSKEELHEIHRKVTAYTRDYLHLNIKGNYQIFPTKVRGVDFVGYRFFGEYTLLRKSTAINFKRKMRACRKKMENNIPPTYSEWCSFNSYKGWLGNCDSYRLSKKYIEPLIDYMQDYYEKEVKGHAEVYRGFLQCG